MATKSIDVELLAKMFLAGAQNIEAKKEYINELNVFPVPDGDTGTNMSMTIMAAAKEVTALEGMDMASLAKAISSGSLRGARGNSGVILSQLLRGFTKSIKTESEIDVPALARAAVRAKETCAIINAIFYRFKRIYHDDTLFPPRSALCGAGDAASARRRVSADVGASARLGSLRAGDCRRIHAVLPQAGTG